MWAGSVGCPLTHCGSALQVILVCDCGTLKQVSDNEQVGQQGPSAVEQALDAWDVERLQVTLLCRSL